MRHRIPKKRILIIFIGAEYFNPLTLTEQIIGTKNYIAVALSPPKIPRTAETFGNTIAMKHVNPIKIEVQTKFSLNEKLSFLKNI